MRGQVPKLAQVTLETVTPLHIGAGGGGGKPFDDECLERTVPSDYNPPPEGHGPPEFVKQYRGWRDREGTPYVPGSTLRGFLRTLYTGALDAGHAHRPEEKADEIFGSTDQAGAIALNDLLPQGSLSISPGGEFSAEFVGVGGTFAGPASYVGDTLPRVLETIFAQAKALVTWLRTGSDGRPNPELKMEGTPIKDQLFERGGSVWTITWKLGRYAKSYAKALSAGRRLQGGAPHAYYPVDGQVPGWVCVTFDLSPPGAEFRLNAWPREERG